MTNTKEVPVVRRVVQAGSYLILSGSPGSGISVSISNGSIHDVVFDLFSLQPKTERDQAIDLIGELAENNLITLEDLKDVVPVGYVFADDSG